LQVELCDPCLSALSVPPWPKKRYINTLPFLFLFPSFQGTIKSRRSLLAPAHLGGPGKMAIKWLLCGGGGEYL